MIPLTEISFRDDTRYTYAVGRIRALENRLLTRTDFGRLLDAQDLSQALRILSEMGYTVPEDAAAYEPVLMAENEAALGLLEWLSEDPPLTDLFRKRYDFHNLKVLLKAKHSGQDLAGAIVDLGTLPSEILAEAVLAGEPDRLSEPLASALRAAEELFSESQRPSDLDHAVEGVQYADMSDVLSEMDNRFLDAWLAWEVDLLNVRSFLRFRWLQEDIRTFPDILLSGGSLDWDFFRTIREEPLESLGQVFQRTSYGRVVSDGIEQLKVHGSFAPLERGCDDLMMELLRTSGRTSFGPEPLAAFVLLKEFEIRSVRAVLVGKLNGLPRDKIKERLPGAYI
jgi:V/A-type H+-transporting ATPase subunit C